MKLFDLEIDKNSWGRIFQSIDAFEPLIKAIFKKHGLTFGKIENLTPGTNAVFKVGNKVVKIYSPVESGFYEIDYFEIEKEARRHVVNSGVASPELLCQGVFEDKYIFRYMVYEFAGCLKTYEILKSFSNEQKHDFATRMLNINKKINVGISSAVIPVLSKDACISDKRWRWEGCPESFCAGRVSVIKGMSFDDPVYVHGDLTAENILFSEHGAIQLIDFEDSLIAPRLYEWPPVAFDLLRLDPVMMSAYFGDYRSEAFCEQLTRSVLIHEYGSQFVRELCESKNVDISTLHNVSRLKSFLSLSMSPD